MHLAGVSQAGPDGAVEVLVESGRRGVLEVVAIEKVEHLDDQLQLPAVADRNGWESRRSHEKKALSRRIVLRRRIVPLAQILSAGAAARWPVGWLLMHFSEVGWAEYGAEAVVDVEVEREMASAQRLKR